tara:strand:+ start:571 stop:759 length:189 start_codon:yes stop_codon:yes gene_type:complete
MNNGAINCPGCKKNLMPGGGNVTFTGNHHLTVGTISTLKCGFCNHSQVLSAPQLAGLGMTVG